MKDTWYVCDPDWDDSLGPMSRAELDRLIGQRKLASTCLAWHADLAEWRPLYGSLGGSTSNAANAAASAANAAQASPKTQEQIAQTSKAQRKAQLQVQQEAQQAQQAARANQRTADSARARANEQRQSKARASSAPPTLPTPADKTREQEANAAFAALAFRRLGARVIDYLLFMPILLAAGFALLQQQFGFWPGRVAGDLDPNGLVWLGILFAVPVEALMLALFGTTFGKWLFGLKVQNHQNAKPDFSVALRRQTNLFIRGMALGIPVLSWIAILVAGVQTMSAKAAPWDQHRGLRVLDVGSPGGIRSKLAIAGVIAALYFFVNDSVLEVVANFQELFGSSALVEAG